MARWLSALDKKLERYSVGSHDDYRVFLSAEPAPGPESHIIPQGILENAIKITNEPPTGMYANLHKALDLFTQVAWPPPMPRAWPSVSACRFSPTHATPNAHTLLEPQNEQIPEGLCKMQLI